MDDLEKGDEETVDETKEAEATRDAAHDKDKGMSQSSKDDIGVCVTIILITVLAVIVTSIKIVLIDMHSAEYANFFGTNITTTTTERPL